MTLDKDPAYTGPEHLPPEDLMPIAILQASRLAWVMSPHGNEDEITKIHDTFVDSLTLQTVGGDELFHRVPLRVDKTLNGQRIILFDEITFSHLKQDFRPYGVSPLEVAELYLGSGIAALLLEERVDPKNTEQVNDLWELMSSPSELLHAIDETDMFDTFEQQRLKEMIMLKQENSLAQLNTLRFSLGMLFLQADEPIIPRKHLDTEPPYEQRLTSQCMVGLKGAIAERNVHGYVQLMRALNRDEGTAKRMFAERISELELAVCFPMRVQELTSILEICTPNPNEA